MYWIRIRVGGRLSYCSTHHDLCQISRLVPMSVRGRDEARVLHSSLILYFALTSKQFFSMQGILSPVEWVLSIYGAAAGLLLFSLETQLKFLRHKIADSFGFLYAPILRFLFLLLTASVSWLHHHLFSDAVAVTLVVVAFVNLYAMCCYPEYEDEREVLAREEDRRLGNLIRKEVIKQAAQQRQTTGTESDWL